ncbi:MAG: hypothetical protein KatS3mg103_0191 [Phycisphaerales bacterium]|nr:MAG: hypothetical protein KatS3mg103_0191 [Phycisphaerales bacterium]
MRPVVRWWGTVGAVRTTDGTPVLLLDDGSRLTLESLVGVGEHAEARP